MNDIQELSTHLSYGEIRLHVHFDLLDESQESVLSTLVEMGYSPTLCRYEWQLKDSDRVCSSVCALLYRSTLPGDLDALFDAIAPHCDRLEERFGDAVTLVQARGKLGHNFIPLTKEMTRV